MVSPACGAVARRRDPVALGRELHSNVEGDEPAKQQAIAAGLDDHDARPVIANMKTVTHGVISVPTAMSCASSNRKVPSWSSARSSEPKNCSQSRSNFLWVRLFRVALDGSNSDHLTSFSAGRFVGSGFGIAPFA